MKTLKTISLACLIFGAAQAAVAGPIYLTSGSEPWGTNANIENFDAAFGVGNWDRAVFGDAGVFSDTSDFVYIDGGDGNTFDFETWYNSNRSTVETFVASGGSVFVNAARWGGTDNFDLGFGATLTETGNYSTECTLTTNDFAAAGTVFTGSGCSHDVVAGAGFNTLAYSTAGNILLEKSYGLGHVMLGGMTTTNFHSGNGFDIRVNMLKYANDGVTAVPESSSIVLFGLGLLGLGLARRNKKA